MDRSQYIDLQQIKYRVAQARVNRELIDRLKSIIRKSSASMVVVCPEFNPLFPHFLWEERGIFFRAELIRPTYRITQINKPAEEDSNAAG